MIVSLNCTVMSRHNRIDQCVLCVCVCVFPQVTEPSQRIDQDKFCNAEFLFPETTLDFEKLPLEFKVDSLKSVHLHVHV